MHVYFVALKLQYMQISNNAVTRTMDKCFGNFVNARTYRILYPRNLNFSLLHLWIPRAMRHQWWSMDKHTNGIEECVIITHIHTYTNTDMCAVSRAERDKSKLFRDARTELFPGEKNSFLELKQRGFYQNDAFSQRGTRKIEHLLAVKAYDTCSHTLSPSRSRCPDQLSIYICTEWNAASIADLEMLLSS